MEPKHTDKGLKRSISDTLQQISNSKIRRTNTDSQAYTTVTEINLESNCSSSQQTDDVTNSDDERVNNFNSKGCFKFHNIPDSGVETKGKSSTSKDLIKIDSTEAGRILLNHESRFDDVIVIDDDINVNDNSNSKISANIRALNITLHGGNNKDDKSSKIHLDFEKLNDVKSNPNKSVLKGIHSVSDINISIYLKNDNMFKNVVDFNYNKQGTSNPVYNRNSLPSCSFMKDMSVDHEQQQNTAKYFTPSLQINESKTSYYDKQVNIFKRTDDVNTNIESELKNKNNCLLLQDNSVVTDDNSLLQSRSNNNSNEKNINSESITQDYSSLDTFTRIDNNNISTQTINSNKDECHIIDVNDFDKRGTWNITEKNNVSSQKSDLYVNVDNKSLMKSFLPFTLPDRQIVDYNSFLFDKDGNERSDFNKLDGTCAMKSNLFSNFNRLMNRSSFSQRYNLFENDDHRSELFKNFTTSYRVDDFMNNCINKKGIKKRKNKKKNNLKKEVFNNIAGNDKNVQGTNFNVESSQINKLNQNSYQILREKKFKRKLKQKKKLIIDNNKSETDTNMENEIIINDNTSNNNDSIIKKNYSSLQRCSLHLRDNDNKEISNIDLTISTSDNTSPDSASDISEDIITYNRWFLSKELKLNISSIKLLDGPIGTGIVLCLCNSDSEKLIKVLHRTAEWCCADTDRTFQLICDFDENTRQTVASIRFGNKELCTYKHSLKDIAKPHVIKKAIKILQKNYYTLKMENEYFTNGLIILPSGDIMLEDTYMTYMTYNEEKFRRCICDMEKLRENIDEYKRADTIYDLVFATNMEKKDVRTLRRYGESYELCVKIYRKPRKQPVMVMSKKDLWGIIKKLIDGDTRYLRNFTLFKPGEGVIL